MVFLFCSHKGHPNMKPHKMILIFTFYLIAFELSSFCRTETSPADQGKPEPTPKATPYIVGRNGVTQPVPLAQPIPSYTPEARKARIEGIVVLQAIIRKDGSVDSFKIIRGLGYGLDESAITTIASKWRFKPGTLNGEPVDVMANIEVRFRLYDPMVAIIMEPKWEPNPDGRMNGSGFGNLREEKSVRGFTYTCSCKGKFNAGINTAKWVAPSRIEVDSYDISPAGTKYPQPCELKIIMQDFTYELTNGVLIETPIEAIGQEKQ
jgi:TonB family protein